jgi:hypothetical protein
MSELDLIPQDYARRQILRRRTHWFIGVVAALLCLVLLGRVSLALLISVEKDNVSRLQGEKQLWERGKSKLDDYTKRKRTVEKQLLALDELRGRDRLRLFLKALDGAYVPNVWFDEMKYFRRDNLPRTADPLPAAPRTTTASTPDNSAAAGRDIEHRVLIAGHALNHVTLAEFMKKLETQPGIADVSLLDTSPRSYPNALVIDAKLSLLVDERSRRRP